MIEKSFDKMLAARRPMFRLMLPEKPLIRGNAHRHLNIFTKLMFNLIFLIILMQFSNLSYAVHFSSYQRLKLVHLLCITLYKTRAL